MNNLSGKFESLNERLIFILLAIVPKAPFASSLYYVRVRMLLSQL